MKLICIPAFNEEKNIEKIIKDCKKFADNVKKHILCTLLEKQNQIGGQSMRV